MEQRLDRLEQGGLAGGVETEQHPGAGGEQEVKPVGGHRAKSIRVILRSRLVAGERTGAKSQPGILPIPNLPKTFRIIKNIIIQIFISGLSI